MSTVTTRVALLAGATLLVAVQPGSAQTTVPPPPSTDAATAAQGSTGAATAATASDAAPAEAHAQEIIVTGSRIARPDFAAPNPIVSFNAANIQQSGNTNITNFLERVPALTASVGGGQTAGYNAISRPGVIPFGEAGLNLLNLRGLGANRTLVLVNGRRHVAGEVSTAAVDINSIPTDLVERVDVLTGGASAVYGADGVSGVVNFILKRDFDGIQARSQMGISQQGDAANHFASIIAGHNFADGRGNVTLAYEYNSDDPLTTDSRSFLLQNRRRYLITNPADVNADGTPDNPRIPDNVLTGDVHYAGESTYGAIDINGDGFPDFRGDGQRYNPGRLIGSYAVGGDSTPAANYIGDLTPRVRRQAANLLAHFDASNAFKLSVEAKFAQTHVTTFYNYGGDYPSTLFLDNPYMPDSIRQAALAAGLTSVQQTRDNWDEGRHGEDDRRRTYRGVIDATGRISDHATYDVYYEFGRTSTRITKLNDRLGDRYLASLDAVTDPRTGQVVCRSSIDPVAAAALGATTFTPGASSGCVPVNTFGANTVSQAALNFFRVNDASYARITQNVADASISGDFGQFFKLPGGPVQFALGGEYRREESRFSPNQLLQNNQFYEYDEPGFVQPVAGGFHVWEAFGELNAPILSDRRFAQTLSVGAAGRYSHYSTIGSTRTWQFNGVYAPVRAISFRGSYGKAVRAPNVGELYTPTAASTDYINDPCDVQLRNNGTQYRAANCVALLRRLGVDPAAYAPVTNPNGTGGGDGTSFGAFTGNPGLKAETARTWTAGVVLRPDFLRNFNVSIDWYDIRLAGAISTPNAQTEAQLCVDQPTLDNVYCANITRASGPALNAGRIQSFLVQPQNVASYHTAGLDLNVNYLLTTRRFGAFDFRFVGGYLHRLDIIQTPGADVEDDIDQALPAPRPKFNFVFSPTWSLGKVTVAYNLRWYDRLRRNTKLTTDNDPDYYPSSLTRYRELWQHDLQVGYAVNTRFSLYAGVTNLTNQKPDEDATDFPISSLGRYFYAGARVNLSRR